MPVHPALLTGCTMPLNSLQLLLRLKLHTGLLLRLQQGVH